MLFKFRIRTFFLVGVCALAATPAQAADKPPSIHNETLLVTCDERGSFTIRPRSSGKAWATNGRLNHPGGRVAVIAITDATFGAGQAIEVSSPNGARDRIMLFPRLPFVLFHSRPCYDGSGAVVMNSLPMTVASLDLGKPPDELRVLGTGGLTTPAQKPGSYAFLAVADPQTRHGVVGGWLTHDRGSGVVFADVEQGQVRINARIDYGRLRLASKQPVESETFALGWFADARLGLEAWADAIARVYAIKLPPEPTGYCTWYHARASDAKRLARQTAFAAEKLAPFGLQVVQIDDGWQAGARRKGPAKNFATAKKDGPYPAGMKAAADDIKKHGLTPGIWFMPFAGDHLDPYFRGHPEWFVKQADGQPYETPWGGTSLDMTHPGARQYLRDLVRRVAHDWGYRYFKMDGLWTGTATRQMYVNSGYKDDHIGDAVFHNPDKTNIEAYRDGLKLVRTAAGPEVFLLGCCAPQNMRSFGGAFGLVDAMRIGPDNGPKWNSLVRGPTYGSRTYFLHGRVWYNDPDPVYVRPEVPLDQARLICSWVAVSGQLNVSSESYADLPADRLDLLKRTMPYHGLRPRPADLFEHEPPRLWLLTDERRFPRRDVVALYNWDTEKAAEFDYPLDRLGLSAGQRYVAFDYWGNTLLPPFEGRLRVSVPKQTCRVLAVRPALDRPQVISTSRHIAQGVVDLLEEKWDDTTRTLSGRSQVVGGDPYELRVISSSSGQKEWTGDAVRVSDADRAAGVRITSAPADGLVRVRIASPAGRVVSWSLSWSRVHKVQGP